MEGSTNPGSSANPSLQQLSVTLDGTLPSMIPFLHWQSGGVKQRWFKFFFGCVALDKWLSSSVPQLSHLKKKKLITVPTCEDKWDNSWFTWQGVFTCKMCYCYYLVAVLFPALHFHNLIALTTHLMLDKLIPSGLNFGHQIFQLVSPLHSWYQDINPEHYQKPQGHIGISLHHAEACPFSVYLSGNCTLIDTYMHLLFSCCLLDPDHVTSALTCSGFTCPTSAAEPESLCLRAFLAAESLFCTCHSRLDVSGKMYIFQTAALKK